MTQKELLQLIGRELFPDWKMIAGLGGGLRYRKPNMPGITDSIDIATSTYRDGFSIGMSLNGYRSFDAVEDIMELFCRKHNKPGFFITIKIFKDAPFDWARIPIESASDLAPLLPPMREVVFDQMLPFLNRFNTIEAVYAHAKDMDHDQRALFVHSPVPDRMLIMKRLVGAPDFSEYGDWLAGIYTENPQYDLHGFFFELYDHLKKM